MKNMLLISSAKYQDTGYLTHSIHWLKSFLSAYQGKKIAFIPYASVKRSYDLYEQEVQLALAELNMEIISVHHAKQPKEIIEQADVIAIGGGNTFNLLKQMYHHQLIDFIRQKVNNGTPYFAWSAGSCVACSSIMTTNDMPITYPPSFDGLNLFPHHINAHFTTGKIPGHNGESREQRLAEFLIANPETQVYALPEGTALQILGNQATVLGTQEIFCFSENMQKTTFSAGSTFNYE